MKLTTVVGARPQFIKAALLSREFADHGVNERIIHTGQHYDDNMSEVFFRDLGIPRVAQNFDINQGGHGDQTGNMLIQIEQDLFDHRPDALMVYGDTNSTLAGALAASKMHIPVIHIEAGLRSFDKKMPEEINRILTDHVSDALLCPTPSSIKNLENEGIVNNVHLVGDVMELVMKGLMPKSPKDNPVFRDAAWDINEFALLTIHRAENTDSPDKLKSILNAIDVLDIDVVFPIHPRTKHCIEQLGWVPKSEKVHLIEPQGYIEMISLLSQASVVVTDSGGLQKEAAWAGKKCVTLRDTTEWTGTIDLGWNILVGSDTKKIVNEVVASLNSPKPEQAYTSNAMSVQQIIDVIKKTV